MDLAQSPRWIGTTAGSAIGSFRGEQEPTAIVLRGLERIALIALSWTEEAGVGAPCGRNGDLAGLRGQRPENRRDAASMELLPPRMESLTPPHL